MKIRNIIRLAVDSLIRRWFVYLLLVAMCVIATILIDKSLTGYIGTGYYLNLATDTYSYGAENSYAMMFDPGTRDKYKDYRELIEDLYENDRLRTKGIYVRRSYSIGERFFDVYVIDEDLIDYGNIELTKKVDDSRKRIVYIGSELKDIMGVSAVGDYEMGTEVWYDYCVDERYDKTVIGGVVEDGALWPDSGDPTVVKMDIFLKADSYSVIVEDDPSNWWDMLDVYNFYFTLDEDLSEEARKEILQEIEDNARSRGIIFRMVDVGDAIDVAYDEIALGDNKVFVATVLIVVMAAISIMCATIIGCILRKREYGIMYANGIGQRDIALITFIQNGIVVFLSVAGAFIYRHNYIVNEVARGALDKFYTHVHLYQVGTWIGIIMALIIAVSVTVPIVLIYRMQPADLVKQED